MRIPANITASYVQRWCRAVVRLADGVAAQRFSVDREMDCQLFALALAQLLRAVKVVALETKIADVAEALARFDSAFPHAKDVRDQLTHFDAYERGVGDLQRKPKNGLRPMMPSASLLLPAVPFSPETAADGWNVEIQLGDYRLPVVGAARAARRLGDDVVRVISTLPSD